MEKLEHDLNCLRDADRRVRKDAISRLQTTICGNSSSSSSGGGLVGLGLDDDEDILAAAAPAAPSVITSVPAATIVRVLQALLRLFSDAATQIREAAVIFAKQLFERSPPLDDASLVAETFLVIRQRLTPSQHAPENCEDVRMLLLDLVGVLLQREKSSVPDHVEQIAAAIESGIVDANAEAKKSACHLLVTLVNLAPDRVNPFIPPLVTALLTCFSHKHFKVRANALEALKIAISCHGNALQIIQQQVMGPLHKLMTEEQKSAVKIEMTQAAAAWIVVLPDSEVHFLLPFLLAGAADEEADVRGAAIDALEKAGNAKLAKEGGGGGGGGEEEEGGPEVPLDDYPHRPSYGARRLVQRHMSQLLTPVIDELGSCFASHRLKAAGALVSLGLFAEGGGLGELERPDSLLTPLAKALLDEDKDVATQVERCCRFLGAFIPPSLSVPVVAVGIKSPAQTARQTASWLRLLSCFLRGGERFAPKRTRALIAAQLPQIAAILTDNDLCESDSADIQSGLLAVLTTVSSVAGSDSRAISDSLFAALLRLQSLSSMPAIVDEARAFAPQLASSLGYASDVDMFARHCENLLVTLLATHKQWRSGSHDLVLFSTLLRSARDLPPAHISSILPVLGEAANPERDPDVRIGILILMKQLIDETPLAGAFAPYSRQILEPILMKCCVWHAGRVSVVIRKAAVAVIKSLLCHSPPLIASDELASLFPALLPQWIGVLEDDDPEVRFVVCQLSVALLSMLQGRIAYDDGRQVWIHLLKRLDDSNDRIRIETAAAFAAFFPGLPRDYESGQFDYLIRGILVHLDDSNKDVQDAIEAALRTAAPIAPKQFIEICQDVKSKHRTKYRCDDLISFAQNL